MAEQPHRGTAQRSRDEDEGPDVRTATGGQESINSASEEERIPDALGNMPERASANRLADKTQVIEFGENRRTGETITAAASEPGETGPFGMALPQAGELHGGNIKAVLEPPPTDETAARPLTKERAAMLTPIYQKLAPFVNRPPSEWGIIGPGERIRGHMLLLNLHTGEKTRAMDGHRVNEGELYANLRQLPESLATGDTIEQILGRGSR